MYNKVIIVKILFFIPLVLHSQTKTEPFQFELPKKKVIGSLYSNFN